MQRLKKALRPGWAAAPTSQEGSAAHPTNRLLLLRPAGQNTADISLQLAPPPTDGKAQKTRVERTNPVEPPSAAAQVFHSWGVFLLIRELVPIAPLGFQTLSCGGILLSTGSLFGAFSHPAEYVLIP